MTIAIVKPVAQVNAFRLERPIYDVAAAEAPG
jgi:hypothetical protein